MASTHSPLHRQVSIGVAIASLVGVTIATPSLIDSVEAQSAVQPTAQAATTVDPSLYSGMRWRSIGPDRGGRSIAVAGSDARPNEYYFGAVGGGVWKTTDYGVTWAAGQRHALPHLLGGRACRRAVESGRRVRRHGRVVLPRQHHPGRRRLQDDRRRQDLDARRPRQTPKSSARFASTRPIPTSSTRPCSGIPTTHTRSRRLSLEGRRQDLGEGAVSRRSHRRDRPVDGSEESRTCCTPRSGRCIARRGRWKAAALAAACSSRPTAARPGPTSRRTQGLPSGLWGRVGVSVSGADSNRVYAIIENDNGGVFVSDDAGATWRKTNEDRNLRQRAFYYTHIYADHGRQGHGLRAQRAVLQVHRRRQDVPDTNRFACRTATTTTCGSPPTDNKRMVQANDGGGNVSVNGGQTWSGQGYRDRAVLQRVHDEARAVSRLRRAAGQQHGVRRQPEQPGRRRGQPAADLLRRGRRRERLHRARSERHCGVLRRQLRRLSEPARSRHRPAARDQHLSRTTRWAGRRSTSRNASSGRSRSCSRRPIPKSLYASSQHLWRTTNGGQRWEKISPNLTRSDPKTMQASGGPITKDQTGVETYAVDLHGRAVAPGRQHDLDRIGRRLGARDARRRQELGARHAARSAGVHAHQPDRSVAAPERRRLSRRQPLSAGRSAPLRLQDGRLRQDVEEDRHRHPRRRLSRARSAKTRSGAGCCMSAPNTASTSRSTTARRGSRCG